MQAVISYVLFVRGKKRDGFEFSLAEKCFLMNHDILYSHFSQTIPYASQDKAALQRHIECVEDQEHLRSQLSAAKLVAFVRDGAVLPRVSGADDRPMDSSNVTLFRSPDSLSVEFDLPHAGK